MGAEGIDKVAGIVHADAVGDLRYRQVGRAQQLLCARQAQLRQIFAGRLAEVVLKAPLEMVFADIIARRERIERELLRVLLVQILPHLLQSCGNRLYALLCSTVDQAAEDRRQERRSIQIADKLTVCACQRQ